MADTDTIAEAEALAGCIRALDALPKVRTHYNAEPMHQRGTIQRILAYLADKYDADLRVP